MGVKCEAVRGGGSSVAEENIAIHRRLKVKTGFWVCWSIVMTVGVDKTRSRRSTRIVQCDTLLCSSTLVTRAHQASTAPASPLFSWRIRKRRDTKRARNIQFHVCFRVRALIGIEVRLPGRWSITVPNAPILDCIFQLLVYNGDGKWLKRGESNVNGGHAWLLDYVAQ